MKDRTSLVGSLQKTNQSTTKSSTHWSKTREKSQVNVITYIICNQKKDLSICRQKKSNKVHCRPSCKGGDDEVTSAKQGDKSFGSSTVILSHKKFLFKQHYPAIRCLAKCGSLRILTTTGCWTVRNLPSPCTSSRWIMIREQNTIKSSKIELFSVFISLLKNCTLFKYCALFKVCTLFKDYTLFLVFI